MKWLYATKQSSPLSYNPITTTTSQAGEASPELLKKHVVSDDGSPEVNGREPEPEEEKKENDTKLELDSIKQAV